MIVALHGTGGDERDIVALADQLDPDATVLAPRGRVLESGMTRWFRRLSEGVFDVEDVIRRAGDLAGFLTAAKREYDISDRRVTAVGFSNGANIASALGILHPDAAPRVIAFSGMYPFAADSVENRLDGSSFLLLNGDADPMAPSASVDRLASELSRAGASVDRRSRPGGHGITRDELDAARAFLAGAV